MANRAAYPAGDAREDWASCARCRTPFGHKLPYDSLAQTAAALFTAYRT